MHLHLDISVKRKTTAGYNFQEKKSVGASNMAKWVEALHIKLEDLSLCLIHAMEGDNGHPQVVA